MKKRILSWALALCMVLTLLPGAAFATDVVASGETDITGDLAIREIVELTVFDLTIIENVDGYLDGYWDDNAEEWIENAWFRYSYTPEFTVTLSDGSVIESQWGCVEIDGENYTLACADDQGMESPWSVGDHEVEASLLGKTVTFVVSVVESPVKSIQVNDTELLEGYDGYLDGYWDDDAEEWIKNAWFRYSYTPEFTVTLSDGSVIESQWGCVEIDGENYTLACADDQGMESPWSVGDHEVEANLLGATATFTVSVIENPVESIQVEDMEVLFGIDGSFSGYWDDEAGEWVERAWFQYHINPDTITVNYKDGSSKTYQLSEISALTNYYVNITSDQTYEHPWGVGTHTATAEYMGVSTEFQVTVKESPVTKIEVIKGPDKTTFLEGESIDFKGAVLRVCYDDGSFEDIEFTDPTVGWNSYLTYHSTHLNRDCAVSISDDPISEAGTYTIELTYLNVSCTYDVTVEKSTITEIEIQNPDQSTLVLRAKKSDGSTEEWNVLALDTRTGDDTPEYAMQGGYMLTDHGCFFAKFYQLTNDGFYMEVGIGPEGTMLKSNVLQTCGWMDFQTLIDYYIYSIYVDHADVLHFDGTVTKENIDVLAEISLYYSRRINQAPQYEVDEGRPVYDGAAVQACILRVFNLPSVDLSLSKNYDPLTGEYTGKGGGFGGPVYKLPVDCIAQNGMWVITASLYYEPCQNLRMVLDESNRIQAFYLYADDHTHEYSEDTVKPTCTEQGHTKFTCSVCGDSYVNYVDALGHDFGEWKVSKEATCTEAGEETRVCNREGCEEIETREVEALGHVWNDGVVTTKPTGTADGVKTYTCTVCGETKTEVIPATGVCDGGASCPSAGFSDVQTHWGHLSIDYCVKNGLMNGVGNGKFDPEGTLTRAMLATILWRQAGEPKATQGCTFTDLGSPSDPAASWYLDAVAWAAETGIVKGRDAVTFDPTAPITRQELATMLYRYATFAKLDTSAKGDLSVFPDENQVLDYAVDAMTWANGAGLITGNVVNDVTCLDPLGNANRAQVATILMRFCENVAK
ncbi:MAG: S-layer homology domain-containing protein [Oscillospiraceae bacterium]